MHLFKSLFDLSYQRDWKQAIIYYLFMLIMTLLIVALIMGITSFVGALVFKTVPTETVFWHYALIINVSIVWGLLILHYKRRSYFPWAFLLVLGAFTVPFFYTITSLIPVAFFSTLKPKP